MLSVNNYIDIEQGRANQYVYRIISIDRLIELFANSKNVLVNPKKWEDPFENFILQSKVRLIDGEIVDFGFRNDFYGQCWSLHKASDAMWRIYSPDSNGVRIRTTISKLAHSLATTLQPSQDIQCFIGKVKYLNHKKMMAFANTVFSDKDTPEALELAKTLLIKRPAFKHENEIRLLYFEMESGKSKDIYKYDINPHHLIDQIMIDPRLDYPAFVKMKERIKSDTKFTGPILRSLLYAPPKDMIFPFG